MIARLVAAAALLVSGGDHYKLWRDGGKHLSTGPLFLVQAAACVIVAILLIAWRHWAAPLVAVALAAGTLLGFVISTLPSGLIGDHEKWQGSIVWVAAFTEIVVVVAGLYAFYREFRSARGVPQGAAVGS